ncbi:MAG: hypothetical protein R2932_02685 [Caldilineaceae bacterium]
MSSVEVLAAVAPMPATVASQETEPRLAGPMPNSLTNWWRGRPKMAPGWPAIVTSYIVNDLRITDTKARTDYLDELGEATATTARALSQTMRADTTLTAVNLTKFSGFVTALNDFLLALTVADPVAIAKARTYAQSFETVFDPEEPSPYIDLGNFANLVTDFAEVPELTEALTALQKAYRATIIAETHGPERPGASGLSLFFPTPDLLAAVGYADSDPAYSAYASRFVGASLWDEFLRFHYLNQDFDPDLVDLSLLDLRTGPNADLSDYAAPLLTDEDEITTPGVDTELTMTPLEVSEDTITTDESLLLATQIEGKCRLYLHRSQPLR